MSGNVCTVAASVNALRKHVDVDVHICGYANGDQDVYMHACMGARVRVCECTLGADAIQHEVAAAHDGRAVCQGDSREARRQGH